MKDQFGDIRITWHGHVAVCEIDKPPHNHVSVQLIRFPRSLSEPLDYSTFEARCQTQWGNRLSVLCGFTLRWHALVV